MGLGLEGVHIGNVDVIRVGDPAALALVQRHIEVFRIDQRRQLLMHALQERRAITGRTGKIGNFVQHPLRSLGAYQCVALQTQPQFARQRQQKRVVRLTLRGQQPAQRRLAVTGDPTLQAMVAAEAFESFPGNMPGPFGRGIALPQQVHMLVGAVGSPTQAGSGKRRRPEQCFHGVLVGHR